MPRLPINTGTAINAGDGEAIRAAVANANTNATVSWNWTADAEL
jgi:hypothetical protein